MQILGDYIPKMEAYRGDSEQSGLSADGPTAADYQINRG
jgi:hypothetical protein